MPLPDASLAGFYLLRVYDMNIATYVAVAINLIVAAAAFAMVRLKPDTTAQRIPLAPDVSREASNLEPPTSNLLICIALSGFCALAAEVVWTRMLSLIFGATVYTFSIILSVFLSDLELAAGSEAPCRSVSHGRRSRWAGANGCRWARCCGPPKSSLVRCRIGRRRHRQVLL